MTYASATATLTMKVVPFLLLPSATLAFSLTRFTRPTSVSLLSPARSLVLHAGDDEPSRILEEIRASGETIPEACKLFNKNLKENGDLVMFEDVMVLVDKYYSSCPIEFRNGDVVNKQGENGGSAKLLSYAALSNMDKETTLKLWGQHYRDVLNTPDGDNHGNIRNFMKYGWAGVPFENGIALTRKISGDAL